MSLKVSEPIDPSHSVRRPLTAGPSTFARKASKALALPVGLWDARRDGDLVLLLFHRVGEGEREIDLPRHAFERHIADLAARDRIVSLEDAITGRGGVVLTFDDGYRDFHEHVLPVLVRGRVPAVLYLATGLVANGAGTGQRSSELLTWSMLGEIVATGLVTVGSHTHSHRPLAAASEREADDEMRRSRDLIEDRLGTHCRHFAYPYCVASAESDRAARRLFATVATDAWRTNRRGRIDLHRLGRTPVMRSDGTVFFRAKARGMLNSERFVYQLARRGPWGVS